MPGKNLSRDPQRTPMQWNDKLNAGFTNGKPWLRLADNYKQVNVAAQQNNEDSLLLFYKKLIMLRQKEPALTTGDYFPVYSGKQIFSFIRKQKGASSFLIAVNLTNNNASFIPERIKVKGTVELATGNSAEGLSIEQSVALKGNEGIIVRLQES
jgi:alpha-glucosidase